MQYRVFYDIARMDKSVDSTDPIELDASEVVQELLPLVKEDGEFLGLVDKQQTTLQLVRDDDQPGGEIWIETPRPDLQGSYGKNMTFEEAHALLSALPAEFPPEGFAGFEFTAW